MTMVQETEYQREIFNLDPGTLQTEGCVQESAARVRRTPQESIDKSGVFHVAADHHPSENPVRILAIGFNIPRHTHRLPITPPAFPSRQIELVPSGTYAGICAATCSLS